MKTIIIKIDKESGTLQVEAVGYDGIECKVDLDNLENILESKTIYSEPKIEEEPIIIRARK